MEFSLNLGLFAAPRGANRMEGDTTGKRQTLDRRLNEFREGSGSLNIRSKVIKLKS